VIDVVIESWMSCCRCVEVYKRERERERERHSEYEVLKAFTFRNTTWWPLTGVALASSTGVWLLLQYRV
jgi:hypothetical protein